jgi:DNA polymerase-1
MHNTDKRLFLLDGMALIYRAFFAFSQNPRITSYGLNTSAVFGFTNTLIDLLKKEKPTHIAVVFDTDAPTERHTDFADYKAHREAMPEDLAKSRPYIDQVIEAFGIPILTVDGYEADDIIGTLAKKAEKMGYTTYMMTPDKDFGQLVSEKIFIYKPGRQGNDMEILGVNEILKKWEVEEVKQVIDILGLWGDSVDNIPGIPGIGEKTAKTLIAKYGSVEGLIAHAHELKGKQKENVEKFAEQAIMSKKLATILLDVPVELNEETFILSEPDEMRLKNIFNELEFRTMAKRIFPESGAENIISTAPVAGIAAASSNGQMDMFAAPVAGVAFADEQDTVVAVTEVKMLDTIATCDHEYHLADSPEKRKDLLDLLMMQEEICFDTETTSIEPVNAEIVGLSFSFKNCEAYYIPFPEHREEATEILNEFRPVFENESILKIGQNIKYDLMILSNYGIPLKGKYFDTMLAHYLIEPDMRHNMDLLAEHYLGYAPISITTLIGKKGAGQLNMRGVEIIKVKDYAAEDADITYRLKGKLEPLLDSRIRKIFEEIEQPLVPVLASIEQHGVRIDKNALNDYSAQLETEIKQLEKDIHALSGVVFNIASPRQLGEVLFEKMKLDDKAKKTKTGQYATGEDVLSYLAPKHEICRKLLDYRQFQKLKSTYVDTLPLLINPRTGRVHTSFNQAVAATGRLSSNNPNLQNIPIKTEKGREVRKAFVAGDDNHVLLSADYSQIELRIIASISGDEGMIEAFKNNIDIHTATAAKVFGVELDAVDREMRRQAKMVNFGIIYGISAFGLAQRLDIPRKDAANIIEQYFAKYPRVKEYMNATINFARENGYVETMLGRRRFTRDINSRNATVRGFAERNAINAPIQGSAADMIKLAMIRIHKRLEEEQFKTRMILQVHDELLFDVPRYEVEKVRPVILEEMSAAMPLQVPVAVEAGIGENWLEAH